MKKKTVLILLIFVLFLFSLAVRYVPVARKGYSFDHMAGNLTLARNFAFSDQFKIESEKNIFLSSARVAEDGIYSNSGSKLTAYIYGYIFKWFGFKKDMPLYLSLVLWALAGVLLFLLTLKLFNLRIAIIFGAVDIFMPVILQGSLMAGFYEWAVLFFSLALLFYLWPKNTQEGTKTIRPSLPRLLLASIFFGLASLARNAFLISFIPFLLYDFWKNRSLKRAVVFLLPFLLLWSAYLAPGYFRGSPNTYFSSQDTSFGEYGHLFPDPYTYHFEKDKYINGLLGTSDYGFSEYLLKYKYPVSFKNKLIMYWHSIKFYPKEAFKLIVTGGPLIILFLLGGLVYLFIKKRAIFWVFGLWGILWYIFLLVPKSNNWNHFLEMRFPMVLLIALGVSWLIDFIFSSSLQKRTKYLVIFVFSICVLLHFVQANKWMLHDEYNTSNIATTKKLEKTLGQYQLDKIKDVVAVNLHPSVAFALNYWTDNNIIYFDAATIQKLLAEQKLAWAFEQFGVTKIIGFEPELSRQIVSQTGVGEIKFTPYNPCPLGR